MEEENNQDNEDNSTLNLFYEMLREGHSSVPSSSNTIEASNPDSTDTLNEAELNEACNLESSEGAISLPIVTDEEQERDTSSAQIPQEPSVRPKIPSKKPKRRSKKPKRSSQTQMNPVSSAGTSISDSAVIVENVGYNLNVSEIDEDTVAWTEYRQEAFASNLDAQTSHEENASPSSSGSNIPRGTVEDNALREIESFELLIEKEVSKKKAARRIRATNREREPSPNLDALVPEQTLRGIVPDQSYMESLGAVGGSSDTDRFNPERDSSLPRFEMEDLYYSEFYEEDSNCDAEINKIVSKPSSGQSKSLPTYSGLKRRSKSKRSRRKDSDSDKNEIPKRRRSKSDSEYLSKSTKRGGTKRISSKLREKYSVNLDLLNEETLNKGFEKSLKNLEMKVIYDPSVVNETNVKESTATSSQPHSNRSTPETSERSENEITVFFKNLKECQPTPSSPKDSSESSTFTPSKGNSRSSSVDRTEFEDSSVDRTEFEDSSSAQASVTEDGSSAQASVTEDSSYAQASVTEDGSSAQAPVTEDSSSAQATNESDINAELSEFIQSRRVDYDMLGFVAYLLKRYMSVGSSILENYINGYNYREIAHIRYAYVWDDILFLWREVQRNISRIARKCEGNIIFASNEAHLRFMRRIELVRDQIQHLMIFSDYTYLLINVCVGDAERSFLDRVRYFRGRAGVALRLLISELKEYEKFRNNQNP